jgi:hypothetical protein
MKTMLCEFSVHACPEPVLADRPLSMTNKLNERMATFRSVLSHLEENGTFFEFSLCLSRACLGKMIVFI